MYYKNYRWVTPLTLEFMEKDYLLPNQTLDERVDIICKRAEEILQLDGFASRFKENLEKGWYSLSTPIWANFGTDRGLPISCFGSYIDDSMVSILDTISEVGMMTKAGGGTSAYFGKIRPRGSDITNNGKSSGAVHFMQMFDTLINVVSQGKVRRGNFAAYLDIEHPDVHEFLNIRQEGNPIQDLSFGVCVTRNWLDEMRNGDEEKRKIWAKVIQSRSEVGYPYIFFTDNANENKPDVYKDNDMKIYASNLCSEIFLPSSSEESFVCDLSSMNVRYFNEWKDTDAVKLLTFFLDAVATEFIEKASVIKHLERAVRFTKNHRALGIGILGWHTFLQENMIAWESMEAKQYSSIIMKTIRDSAYSASNELYNIFGASELMTPYKRRNSTLLAIAPTKSSAFILEQVSEGIEPHKANYYIKDLAKGKFTIKNKQLEKLLTEKGQNITSVWNSILQKGGSVQHLDFLTKHEKNVFKTFGEISQKEILIQASIRQKFIDQGQSLNLMIHPSTSAKDVNSLLLFASDNGIKSLYYQFSVNAAQDFTRDLLSCVNCES